MRRVSCGIEMRHCWNGPISPLVAGGGRVGRSRFFEWVVMVVDPSGSPTTVPCDNLLRFFPGVCGAKKLIVAPESRMP